MPEEGEDFGQKSEESAPPAPAQAEIISVTPIQSHPSKSVALPILQIDPIQVGPNSTGVPGE